MRHARPLLLAGTFIALVSFALLMRLSPAGAGAIEPKISLLPPAGDVHVGQTFTVVAYAEHFEGVGAYELELRFDDDEVAFLAFDDGDVLGSTGRTVYCLTVPTDPGSAMWGCASSGAAPGVSGDGVLALLTFQALEIGNVNIRLRDAALADVNGDPIDVDTENATVFISEASGSGDQTPIGDGTPDGEETSAITSTVEPDETAAITATVESETPDTDETTTPEATAEVTEGPDETQTPVPTATEPAASETPAAATETPAVETEVPAPSETPAEVETETPETGETPTPATTETVAAETETPEGTATPGEERPTETATPDTTKPSETPESTGTPGFVPPTATPGAQTATTTSVATATNTSTAVKTHTPAASVTSESESTPDTTASPGAGGTVVATGTTNAVLGTTNDDGPTGVVLPVTGTGDRPDDGMSPIVGVVGALTAAGIGLAMLATHRRKKRA